MAAVPSIGRASRIEGELAPEADATRALYEQYANQVFRYCLHQLGSREEAEDAVQSTFLNAFRGIKRGVVPELEAAWLFKIAHNVCLSRRRSAWRRGRIESPADFELIEELTPAPARRGDELIGLQDVLERLPDTQRRAILLREWQGLSYREIAAELELSQAAVETLIFRARRSLASGLEQPPEKKRRAFRTLERHRLESKHCRKRPVERDEARLAHRSWRRMRVEELREVRVGVLEVPASHVTIIAGEHPAAACRECFGRDGRVKGRQ